MAKKKAASKSTPVAVDEAPTAVVANTTAASVAAPPAALTYLQQVSDCLRAGFSGIWIKSSDHANVIADLMQLCASSQNPWALAHWDAADGLLGTKLVMDQKPAPNDAKQPGRVSKDGIWYDRAPGLLLSDVEKIAATAGTKTVFVLKNFHRKEFLDNINILQATLNTMHRGKSTNPTWCVVVLAPTVAVPMEWQNNFQVIEHPYPDKQYLSQMASKMLSKQPSDRLNGVPEDAAGRKLLIDDAVTAAAGMSFLRSEDAFALSIVQHKTFDAKSIHMRKAEIVRQSGLLNLLELTPEDTFENMSGLAQFERFSKKLLEPHDKISSRGLLLLGIPGSGKSQAVKCLGNATGRPVISFDIGALRSKYQGETEHNIRAALQTADMVAPCILFIDEIEKAMSGAQSSGATDGGTGSRVLGTILTWLNDHKSDVFFIGTCNDVSQLLGSNPEFARAERFDGMFFFDVPTPEERKRIWEIYLKMYGVKKHPPMSELITVSNDWTGAEIKSCCRLAVKLDMPIEEAYSLVSPIMNTAQEKMDGLRQWATKRCLATSYSGLYDMNKEVEAKKASVETSVRVIN